MAISAVVFWALADRLVGHGAANAASWRSAPRFILLALLVLALGVAWAIRGMDAEWRVALVLAPVPIVVSAYLLGRGTTPVAA